MAELTGDSSWRAENMLKYFVGLEKNGYLPPGKRGHGYNACLGIETSPLRLVLQGTRLLSLYIRYRMGEIMLCVLVRSVPMMTRWPFLIPSFWFVKFTGCASSTALRCLVYLAHSLFCLSV
ncbi:hypothetical protein BDV35DRAFT_71179 [Aspergillus flavus]|uniref:Uncharacterized protein n=1 Tax=Aspergillus flavus TaxID=5059 RepID=A0A5N6GLR4_ASPFL|nr:hypothetical protein BDV35DRAFT_71179 [Aspergillus flavus]